MKDKVLNTKVIAGKFKGRKLENPNFGTRPITNRIKQSLFDLLNDELNEKDVLDLYAGGGNFGIEALSRGAKSSTFVDISSNATDIIRSNLESLGVSSQAKIIKSNVEDFALKTQELFDVIMADPPFDDIVIEHIQDASKLLKKGGIFVLRLPYTKEAPKNLDGIPQIYSKKYGKSIVYFYR